LLLNINFLAPKLFINFLLFIFVIIMGPKDLSDKILFVYLWYIYKWPSMVYNNNYDPHKPPYEGLENNYSLYIYNKLLYDDRPTKVDYFKKRYILLIIKYISYYWT
jgi:hypothetical protein